MSNSINRVFNPFEQTLADDERLRLQDGVLTVENLSARSSARSWIWLFFTRGQYSQKAILENMANLYSEAIKETTNLRHPFGRGRGNNLSYEFHDNYKTLISRASNQNDKFANVNCITRFFKAKSFIDLSAHSNTLQTIITFLREK